MLSGTSRHCRLQRSRRDGSASRSVRDAARRKAEIPRRPAAEPVPGAVESTRRNVMNAKCSLLLFAAVVLAAESINPPTVPQAAPVKGQEKKNLDLAMNF